MLRTAIGVSDDIDLEDAIEEVIQQCKDQLGTLEAQVGILHTSCMDVDLQELVNSIHSAFPQAQIIGCTTDGEITSSKGFSEDSISLLLLSSQELHFATAVATHVSQDPEASIGKAFGKARKELKDPPKFAIVLPDGLSTVALPLDHIFRQVMGENFPVIGGTAGDHFQLRTTYQFYNNQVYSDAMPILLVGGAVNCTVDVVTGLKPFGDYHQISEVEENVVYKVGDRQILDFYIQEFGQLSSTYPQFSFAVYPKDSDDYFFRSPVSYDENRCSMTFIGQFPKDCRVRLARILREDLRRSAEQANRRLLEAGSGKPPELVFIYSCTSRRHVLGSETNMEFQSFRESTMNIPFFGFYCYGEIGPVSIGKPPRFHSDTLVLLALRTST